MKLHSTAIFLICLLLAAVPAQAQDNDAIPFQGIEALKEAMTRENITDMMSVSMRLKEAGGSYQQALTYPQGSELDDPEARRVLIGVRQFDTLYAAAFGKKQEVARFIKAMDEQVLKLNLKGRMDVASVFPPELNWMAREPDKVNFNEIVDAYADNLSRIEVKADNPVELDVIADSLYGFVVEGLYVTGQSILQAGGDPQMLRVVNGMSPSLEILATLYEKISNNPEFTAILDTAETLELSARKGWIREMADMIVRKGGSLSGNDLQAIAAFAVTQRQSIVTNGQ